MSANPFKPPAEGSLKRYAIVTFPRSGRRLLRWLLAAYQGPECMPGYDLDALEPRGVAVVTHDFRLDYDPGDRIPLVLIRSPLESFASWFLMNVKDGSRPDTEAEFTHMIHDEALPYWSRFVRKWVRPAPQSVFHYEELMSDPGLVLKRALEALGLVPDEDRIRRVLELEEIHPRNNPLRDFRYYQDPAAVEAIRNKLEQV